MYQSELIPAMKGYIAGQWVSADSGRTMNVHNPATGDLLGAVPMMEAAETTRAVEAAEGALAEAPSAEQRKAWLMAIAKALRDNAFELGRIVTLENGKPLAQGEGEAAYAAGFFEYAGQNMDVLKPRRLDERPNDHTWTVHFRPAGVVALITPWNFPLAMVAKKLAASIAAGAPAVVKPSEKTPLSMIALFRLMDRLDMPPGFVNLVIGEPKEIGRVLMEHEAVRVVSFTGSTAVGRHLITASAPSVKRLSLELGGNAPFLVFDDCDIAAATDHLMKNKFRAGGQTCVCTNRVLVQKGVVDRFAAAVAEKVLALKVGNGMEEGVDIGPLIDRAGHDKVRRHLEDALKKGAVSLTGDVPAPEGPNWGQFFKPTVLRGVTPEMACAREETFGPLVAIQEFDTEEDAIRLANGTEYGLAAYVFTKDADRACRVIRNLRFGHVGWNTGSGPAPQAPFGGMKQSGFGREGGPEGMMEFVEIQTVPMA